MNILFVAASFISLGLYKFSGKFNLFLLIAVSNVNIAYVDVETGTIGLYYIDAFDGSQVLDLKPYTPSIDRIENPMTPDWCSHWPKSYEESGRFDWEAEFNF